MRQRSEDEEYITISGLVTRFRFSGSGSEFSIGGSSTGSIRDYSSYRLIRCQFDKYEIEVIVDSDNKFIGISGVSIKRDFLSPGQRIAIRSHIDVDEYYKE